MLNEELIKLYQDGNNQALEMLINQNKGIVYKIANRYYIEGTNSIDREDLEQEGIIGLITAAKKYDFNNIKKAQFITYAVFWINHNINRFVKYRCTNKETSLNAPVNKDDDSELMNYIEGEDYSYENIEEKIYQLQIRDEINKAIKEHLTLKEEEIIKFHYGWDNNKCMNFQEIGEILNIDMNRTRKIEDKALRTLRNSKWARLKAKEIYTEKMSQVPYNVPGMIERIDFKDKYFHKLDKD